MRIVKALAVTAALMAFMAVALAYLGAVEAQIVVPPCNEPSGQFDIHADGRPDDRRVSEALGRHIDRTCVPPPGPTLVR